MTTVTSNYRDPRFPDAMPADITVSSIALNAEEFRVGGERITEARAERIAARLADRAAGRPSLTAPGEHSPRLNLRVPQPLKDRLAQTAREQGRRESDVVREALSVYLGVPVAG